MIADAKIRLSVIEAIVLKSLLAVSLLSVIVVDFEKLWLREKQIPAIIAAAKPM